MAIIITAVLLAISSVIGIGITFFFVARNARKKKKTVLAEGEKQKYDNAIAKFLAVVFCGIPILLFGFLSFKNLDDDKGIAVFFALLVLLFLIMAVWLLRSHDKYVSVYTDHLIVERRRIFFPGMVTERLDYKDIKKMWFYDRIESALKIKRFDGSTIKLPSNLFIDYKLFIEYCAANRIHVS